MDSYKKSRRKSIIAWVIAFVLAIGAAIVAFTPFIFMVLNSYRRVCKLLQEQCDRSCNFPDPATVYFSMRFLSSGKI